MGNTFKLGNYVNGIFQDSSNNIGIGAAPSGTYKFEVTGTAKVSGILTLGSTISNGTYAYTLPSATGTLALVGGAGVGTVTSVAALTIGTSGTDLSSTVATSTTTPVITLNVPTASAANRGALASADWSTFNSKQGTITLTTTGTSGAATFSSNTLNIPNYGSALSGYLPLTGGTLTGALSGTSATFSGNFGVGTASPSVYTNLNTITINGTSGSVIDFKTGEVLYGELYSLANEMRVDAVGASGTLKLLTNSVTRLTIASTGNVGIGTSSPVAKLDISKANSDTVSLANAAAAIGDQAYGVQLMIQTMTSVPYAITLQNSYTSYPSPISLQPTAGNVGIGTKSPSYKLDIDLGSSYVRAYNNAAGFNFYALGNFTSGGQGGIYTGAGYVGMFSDGSYELSLGYNKARTMNFTSGGNVLIGTTTDDTVNKLQVNGSGKFTGSLTVIGMIFTTTAQVSVPNASATTVYTMVAGQGIGMLTISPASGGTTNAAFTAICTIGTIDTNYNLLNATLGTANITVTRSGANIQVTHAIGSSTTFNVTYLSLQN